VKLILTLVELSFKTCSESSHFLFCATKIPKIRNEITMLTISQIKNAPIVAGKEGNDQDHSRKIVKLTVKNLLRDYPECLN
jgi:hypothetical protein